MKESLEFKEIFSWSPSELYSAWLDTEMHGELTDARYLSDGLPFFEQWKMLLGDFFKLNLEFCR